MIGTVQPPLQPKWEEGKCSSIGPLADDNIYPRTQAESILNLPGGGEYQANLSNLKYHRLPFHQKFNGTESQRTPQQVPRVSRYPGFFGVHSVGPTVGDFFGYS